MDRLVTVVVLGHEIPVMVSDAKSDGEAKSLVIDKAAKSFHVRAVTQIRKTTSLWDLLKDAFTIKRTVPAQ